MTDSQLTELMAETTHEYERHTSGIVRHLQWHAEMAEDLQARLSEHGYSIVSSDVMKLPQQWRKTAHNIEINTGSSDETWAMLECVESLEGALAATAAAEEEKP